MNEQSGFTRNDFREIAEAVLDAVRPLEETFGVRATLGRGTFGTTAGVKIEFARVSKEGTAETKERQAFREYASIFGLTLDMLDRTFRVGGDEYRITGLNPNARKMPVHAVMTRNGKTYTFTAAAVARALATPG